MKSFKIKPMEFCDEIYILLYGEKANIVELRKQKGLEIWDDIIAYLAKDDITKIKEIRELPVHDVLKFLQNKAKTIKANMTPLEKDKIEPVGFKLTDKGDKFYKIVLNTETEQYKADNLRYNEDTGLNVGDISNEMVLAEKILKANTGDGQSEFKKQNDTEKIKHAIKILPSVQSDGIREIILELLKEPIVSIKITRLR